MVYSKKNVCIDEITISLFSLYNVTGIVMFIYFL